jgi:ribosomal protein S18 acetylase RimI-like enzyme
VPFFENFLQQQTNCMHFGAFTESRKSAIGWVTLGWIGGYGKLVSLFVHPQFRSDGIGGHLVRQVICSALAKNLVHVDLEVAIENNVAKKLYEQSGFIKVGSSSDRHRYRCSLPE